MKKVVIVIAMLIGLPMSILFVNAWRTANNMNQQALEERNRLIVAFDQYRSRLLARDFQSAYEMTSKEFKAADSFERFTSSFSALENQHGKLVKIDVADTSVVFKRNEWKGHVLARFTFEQKEIRVLNEFHMEDSHWAVFGTDYDWKPSK